MEEPLLDGRGSARCHVLQVGYRAARVSKRPREEKTGPGEMGPLAEYLWWVREIRSRWAGKDKPQRKGEEETLWFRGHLCADWRLIPKLYRKEYKGADENEIRQEFQSRALQLIQGRLPGTKWEWYFLMQHYGAPTRLLDWTDNFLVALYFAVQEDRGSCERSKDYDAAVWVLDPWWLNRKLKKGIVGPMLPDWDEAKAYLPELEEAFHGTKVTAGSPAAIDPPYVDRRLAAQGSRFAVFGKHNPSSFLISTGCAEKSAMTGVSLDACSRGAQRSCRTSVSTYNDLIIGWAGRRTEVRRGTLKRAPRRHCKSLENRREM